MKRKDTGKATTQQDAGAKQKQLNYNTQLRNVMTREGECNMFPLEIPDEKNKYILRLKMPAATFLESYPHLCQDLFEVERRYNYDHVELLVYFPSMFPSVPPFVRVVKPRFRFHTGHVTVGGSICTELLTTSGWISSMTIENLILFLHRTIIDGQGRVDLTSPLVNVPYDESEARQAFQRVSQDHGWVV